MESKPSKGDDLKPKPSMVFDRPLSNRSRVITDEKVLEAIKLVREKRHDLWDRFTEHEHRGEGYADLVADLDKLLGENMGITQQLELSDLCFEIRKEVRRKAGLWY